MHQLIQEIFDNVTPDKAEAEAFISLAMLVMNCDKSVSREENQLMDTLIGADIFTNAVELGKIVGKIRGASIEALKDESETEEFITLCLSKIKNQELKKELNGKLLEMSQVNNEFSKTEQNLLKKIIEKLKL